MYKNLIKPVTEAVIYSNQIIMYKLCPCVSLIVSVSQSSKSSTAQQVASWADSLSSLLHVGIGHHQISVSRRWQ